ncbi:hypothetical protein NCCP2495_19430 [Dietzia sp. NCCP-2495]|uniref:helix-turn-helix domain-containing protein n=1 Tax=Dietzia sp. NCCP-2495 TaxID=2934675 RepID=UPI002232487D|nr:helix-turn-helix transcriptional regulator [Dietzia sp. NCCP-2495]GLB64064.1 hypothetical protein NCCP2495_19430 [Dietzia sp. NCCP-2495]
MSESSTGRIVGENLRKQRISAGLSQAEVASKANSMGLSWAQANVTTIETGRRQSITIDELLVLSIVFECPLSSWFAGTGDVAVTEHMSMKRSVIREALAGETPTPSRVVSVDFSTVEDYSADESAARVLGITQEQVTQIAVDLWGHSLTAERDKRLSEHADKSPRELRTLRGGMTKRLSKIIRQQMEE